jgi:hypothetical protein
MQIYVQIVDKNIVYNFMMENIKINGNTYGKKSKNIKRR